MAVFTTLLIAAQLLLQTPQTLPPQAAAPPSTGTGELRGVVIDGRTGQPVSDAVVRLAPFSTAPGARPRLAKTDAVGQFVLGDLPDGQYQLSVQRADGNVVTAFGQRAPRARTIDIIDGAHVRLQEVLQLPSGASISGRVFDEHGEPFAGAVVSAWHRAYLQPGERQLWFEGQAQSDEHGDFQIVGLKPGTFFIDAKASAQSAPTFFPAASDAAFAQPVTLLGEVTASGISIQLRPMPLARVSGTVISSAGTAPSEFVVLLGPVRDDGAQIRSVDWISEVDSLGRFEIAKLPPGAYSVSALSKSRLLRIGATDVTSPRVEREEFGSVVVTVNGADQTDVVVSAIPMLRLTGRVTLDRQPTNADFVKALSIRVTGRSSGDRIGSILSATSASPNPDGSFVVPIATGGRLVRVDGLPRGVVLQRVVIGGVDVTDDGFDVAMTDVRDVEIALTMRPTQVEGRVQDNRGAAVAGVGVIVFAEDARKWTLTQARRIASARTGKDGAFTVSGLPSGAYLAATVPQLVDGEWASPEYLESLRRTATAFKIGDGELKSLTLRR